MKIIHICLCGQFNENLSYQDNLLTKYHSLLGHEVSVIAPTIRFSDDGKTILDQVNASVSIINDNIKLYRVAYKLKYFKILTDKLRVYKGVNLILEKEKPDFMFIHGVQFLEANTVIKYLKRNPKVIAVADNHADYHNSLNNWFSKYILHRLFWKNVALRLEKSCKVLYGVTPIRCSFLTDVYNINAENVKLLPLGADDILIKERISTFGYDEVRKSYDIPISDFLITSGGKLDPLKNIDKLILAIDKLKYPNVKLLLFGSLLDDTLKEFIANYSFVKYVGWQDQNQIIDILLSSDLLCFPGTHSVLWEQAIACGKPVIFNRIEGMGHVESSSTILLDGNNIDSISSIFDNIIGDKEYFDLLNRKAVENSSTFYYSTIAAQSLVV